MSQQHHNAINQEQPDSNYMARQFLMKIEELNNRAQNCGMPTYDYETTARDLQDIADGMYNSQVTTYFMSLIQEDIMMFEGMQINSASNASNVNSSQSLTGSEKQSSLTSKNSKESIDRQEKRTLGKFEPSQQMHSPRSGNQPTELPQERQSSTLTQPRREPQQACLLYTSPSPRD